MQARDTRNQQPKVVDLKTPPAAIESEESIIGGILIDHNAISRVIGRLEPGHFYNGIYGEIYKTALGLYLQSKPHDATAVAIALSPSMPEIKATIFQAMESTPSAVNIDLHAEEVINAHKRRQLISICREVAGEAYNPAIAVSLVQERAESQIFELGQQSHRRGLRPFSDVVMDGFSEVEANYTGEAEPALATGFYDLDNLLDGGFRKGELIVVGGRPGMGKSAFVGSMGRAIAQTHQVALFSLEMAGGEIAKRILASESSVSLSQINRASLTPEEWQAIGSSTGELMATNLWVDDSEDVTPAYLISQCRALKSRVGLDLVIIDYLHLMQTEGDDETRELGRLTRSLKKMAKALKVPVVLLSQLSRAVESRGSDKRPICADLRQSGSIEQDADKIIFLYRDEVYNPDTHEKGVCEVLLRKNRNGSTGTVKLLFEPQYSRFRNLARSVA